MNMAELGEDIILNIKFNNHIYKINIQPSDTVADIKQKSSQQSKTDVAEIEILFSGKILQSHLLVKDLCIGQNSVLHVFHGRQKPSSKGDATSSTESQITEAASNKSGTYQYYVFCKTCHSLQPGKLRVRCLRCKDGGILLDRDPCSWTDVLFPDRIHGTCVTAGCEGSQTAQFYFKCSNHQSDAMETAVPLQHIRPNRRQIECITCGMESPLVLVFPCQQRHVMCLECFRTYALVSLNNCRFIQDEEFGYSLPCPAGCENSLIRENHHFCLLGTEEYERYKQFGAEQCLLQNGGLLCPKAGCGEGLFPSNDVTLIQCTTCHYVFCRQCRQDYHTGDCSSVERLSARGEMSELDEERAQIARWEENSMETISMTTKPCPNCKTRTEKFEGCMHMTCTLCKKDWCWLCENKWNRDCQGDHWFG